MTKKKLSARRKEEAVDIENIDGSVVEWTVREMDGDTRDEYMKTRQANFHHDKQGQETGVKDTKDLLTNLLKFCLFTAADNKPVPVEVIRPLPTTTQQELFQMALVVNGLKDEAAQKGGSQQSEQAGTNSPEQPAA